VLLRMHTEQVFIGRGSRLDHLAALFGERRSYSQQHAGALRPLGVAGRRHVIGESFRTDEH
jgi:hypothetical protein